VNGLADLPTFDGEGNVNVVVEAPRGSTIKLVYEPDLRAFKVRSALPLGLSYPFDWGFITGTRAEDEDPVDALLLNDVSTYPGVVIGCDVLGMLVLDQEVDGEARREINNRVVVRPSWERRLAYADVSELHDRVREEIEQFFLNVTFFTSKNARLLGWKGRAEAEAFVRARQRADLVDA